MYKENFELCNEIFFFMQRNLSNDIGKSMRNVITNLVDKENARVKKFLFNWIKSNIADEVQQKKAFVKTYYKGVEV